MHPPILDSETLVCTLACNSLHIFRGNSWPTARDRLSDANCMFASALHSIWVAHTRLHIHSLTEWRRGLRSSAGGAK